MAPPKNDPSSLRRRKVKEVFTPDKQGHSTTSASPTSFSKIKLLTCGFVLVIFAGLGCRCWWGYSQQNTPEMVQAKLIPITLKSQDALDALMDLDVWQIQIKNCSKDSSEKRERNKSVEGGYISFGYHSRLGMGNSMFLYASTWGIAKQSNLKMMVVRPVHNLEGKFRLEAGNGFNLSDCNNLVHGNKVCCMYHPETENLKDMDRSKNVSLWGFFMSYKYFHPHAQQDIRRQFEFSDEIKDDAQRIIHENTASLQRDSKIRRPIVGIQIRRGDILEPFYQKHGFLAAPEEYFHHAVEYLQQKGVEKPIYLICTNDPQWAKEHLRFPDTIVIENSSPAVDLVILTQADHLILSVGTYTFWAGYLSNAKNIIYYKNWPKAGSIYGLMTKHEDFWLPEWTPLE